MGDCSLELYSGPDDSYPEDNSEQIYDVNNEDVCIQPDFTWNYFLVTAFKVVTEG